MQGDVNNLTDSYQKQMDQLFAKHAESMESAKQQFANAVHQATQQFQTIISQAQLEPQLDPEPDTPEVEREAPLAVWSKTCKGEDCLILNREAAIMQMALLERLGGVLQELQKLAPKSQRTRR